MQILVFKKKSWLVIGGGCWQLETGGISRGGCWMAENGAGVGWGGKCLMIKRKCKLIFARSAFILRSTEK